MADVEVLTAHDFHTARSETGGPTYHATIAGGDFTTDDEYLIIYTGFLGGNDNNSLKLVARAPDGAGVIDIARVEVVSTTQGDETPYGQIERVTADGSNSADIGLEEVSSATAYGHDFSVVAINLSDLVENTDYWWTEAVLNEGVTTTDRVAIDNSIEVTDGETYLVLASVNLDVDSINAQLYFSLEVDGAALQEARVESEDAEENRGYILGCPYVADASESKDFQVWIDSDVNDGWKCQELRLLVLRLDSFESFVAAGPVDDASPSANTWNEIISEAHTPTTTGDHVVLGGVVVEHNHIAIFGKYRLEIDDADFPGDPSLWTWSDPYDWYDETPLFYAVGVKEITDGGSTIDLDGYPSSSTADFRDAWLAAFSVKLVSAAGPQSVTTGTATRTRTAGAAALTPGALTVTTGAVSRTRAARAATLTPGALTATTGAASRARTAGAVGLTPGALSVTTGAASRSRSAQAATVTGALAVTTGVASRARAAQASTLTPGALTVTTGAATRSRTAQASTLTPGALSVTTGTVSRSRTAGAAALTPGALSVTTGAVSRSRTAQTATLTPGALSATTGAASRSRSAGAATLTPGALSVTTGAASRSRSALASTLGASQSVTTGTATRARAAGTVTVTGALAVTTGAASRARSTCAATLTPGALAATTGPASRTRVARPATIAYTQSATTGPASRTRTALAAALIRARRYEAGSLTISREAASLAAAGVGGSLTTDSEEGHLE